MIGNTVSPTAAEISVASARGSAGRGHHLTWQRAPSTVLAPLVILALYLFWLISYLATNHDIWGFVLIGRAFAPHAAHARPGTGYDGQWYYYLATDLLHAQHHLDKPGYRYLRILYPLVAGGLSLGQSALVPYTLVLVNVCAVVEGTFAVAIWLGRRGISPWWSLVYGLYPGLLMATARDVAEPLAFGLVAVSVLLLDRHRWWAALCFSLAAVTRESTALFPLVFGLWMLWEGGALTQRIRTAASFLGVSLLPIVLYKIVLVLWLGSAGYPAEDRPVLAPLGGILSWWPWQGQQIEAVVCIVLPALGCLTMCARAVYHRKISPVVVLLTANIVIFVFMLGRNSFGDIYGSLRVTTGVLLSALYCVPQFDVFARRRWLWISSGFWLALAPAVFLLGPLSMLAGAR